VVWERKQLRTLKERVDAQSIGASLGPLQLARSASSNVAASVTICMRSRRPGEVAHECGGELHETRSGQHHDTRCRPRIDEQLQRFVGLEISGELLKGQVSELAHVYSICSSTAASIPNHDPKQPRQCQRLLAIHDETAHVARADADFPQLRPTDVPDPVAPPKARD
jgi:hypothetical protein